MEMFIYRHDYADFTSKSLLNGASKLHTVSIFAPNLLREKSCMGDLEREMVVRKSLL